MAWVSRYFQFQSHQAEFFFFVSSEVDEVTHKPRGCPEKKVPSQYYVGEKTIDSAIENEKRFGPFLEKM